MEKDLLFSMKTLIQKAHPTITVFSVQNTKTNVTAITFPVSSVICQKHIVTRFQIKAGNDRILPPPVATVAVNQEYGTVRLPFSFEKLTS